MRRAETVNGEVVICRPVGEVYGFYRDFNNLPRFLGDVVAVEQVGDMTYRWVVSGPFGASIPLTILVTEERLDRLIRYKTHGPAALGARWQLEFEADDDMRVTRVREHLEIPLGVFGRTMLAVIGKRPEREVAANLSRLKQLLETGPGHAAPSAAPPTSFVQPVAPAHQERGPH